MAKYLSKIFSVSGNPQVSEVSLTYYNQVKASDRPVIKSSKDAYNIFLNSWDEGKIELQEEFKILLLNRRGACLGVSTISSGGKEACLVDLKLLFATALLGNACSVILGHNHPSGNLKPSAADICLTRRISEVGTKLDLNVLDHIIVTKENFLSFADEGLVHRIHIDSPPPF